MLLRLQGHEAVSATTGERGIAAVAAHAPQIAILDIGLPDISGYDLARRLRSTYGEELYLAALTGWGDPRDRERAREAGFDRHMLKPVSVTILQELIADASARFARRVSAPSSLAK